MVEFEFRARKYDIEGFTIDEPSLVDLPKGVNPDLLWNLWDMGRKFGQPTEKGLGLKNTPLRLEVHNFSETIGGMDGLTVFKVEPGQDFSIADQGVSIHTLKNGLIVMWDKKLEVQEVQNAMQEIDEYAEQIGLILNGKRLVRI